MGELAPSGVMREGSQGRAIGSSSRLIERVRAIVRILMPVAAAGLLMVALFGTGERTLSRLTGAMDQIVDRNLAGGIQLSDINTRVQNVNARFNRLLVLKSAGSINIDSAAELASISVQVNELIKELQSYRDTYATPEQHHRLDEVLQDLEDYKRAVAWVGSMLGIDFASTISFIEPFGSVFERAQAKLTSIVTETHHSAQLKAEEATRRSEETVRTFLYSAIAVMVGIALLAWLIGRYQQRLRISSEMLRQQVEARTAELRQANDDLAASADTLRQLGDAGLALTATLDLGEVYAALYEHLADLVPMDAFGLARLSANGRDVIFESFLMYGHLLPGFVRPAHGLSEPAVRALRQGAEMVVVGEPATAWAASLTGNDDNHDPIRAAVWRPLMVSGQVLGLITVQSRDIDAYGPQVLEAFRSACAYAAIAIANARSYHELGATLAELRAAQDKLVKQEKMASLGRLVAGVAHEINTPLGVVLTAAGSLYGGVTDLRDAIAQGRLTRSALEKGVIEWAELATVVERNAIRTASLVKSFSAVAVDEGEGRILETDLSVLLDDVVTMFRPALEKEEIHLDLVVTDGLVVRTVPESLTDALTRILSNTIDHAFVNGYRKTHERRVILCAEAVDDKNILITVEDNGRGIDPDAMPHLCDPFFTTARGSGHPGLGLHVAFNQVTQHLKGALDIDNVPSGGARVLLRIPISIDCA
ncbi:ATP-binding protein [Azospirillum sp. B4]|uniref:ATP-binding protein n=1 Tax=Azospirillum sp. B4 TaxID=95605 RepID=UPI000344FBF4|nr:ATP-binding protein [Azospirillum sp. B4]